jgi:hypothetical protein
VVSQSLRDDGEAAVVERGKAHFILRANATLKRRSSTVLRVPSILHKFDNSFEEFRHSSRDGEDGSLDFARSFALRMILLRSG